MSAADTTTPATAETHSAATLPERLPLDGIPRPLDLGRTVPHTAQSQGH